MSNTQFSPENSELSYDIVIEEERKKFICKHPYCGKVFRFKSEIERHVTIHSESRPFKCRYDNCIKTFKRSDALDNHIRCSHTREATYTCPFPGCEMSFAAHGSFRHHVQKSHKNATEEDLNQDQSNSAQTVKRVKLNSQIEYNKEVDSNNQSQISLQNDFFVPKVPNSNNSTLWQVSTDDNISTAETNKTEKSERMNQMAEENSALKNRLLTNEKVIKCMQNQINTLLSSFFTCQSGIETKPENSTFPNLAGLNDNFLPEGLEQSKDEEATLVNIINCSEEIDFFATFPNVERKTSSNDPFPGFGNAFEFEKDN